MNELGSLLHMLQRLLEDMLAIQQTGAGYYSCVPLIRRYNKLLAHAKAQLAQSNSLIDTFDDLAEGDPKDPAEKMKLIQGIRVEAGQLIALLEAVQKESKPS